MLKKIKFRRIDIGHTDHLRWIEINDSMKTISIHHLVPVPQLNVTLHSNTYLSFKDLRRVLDGKSNDAEKDEQIG